MSAYIFELFLVYFVAMVSAEGKIYGGDRPYECFEGNRGQESQSAFGVPEHPCSYVISDFQSCDTCCKVMHGGTANFLSTLPAFPSGTSTLKRMFDQPYIDTVSRCWCCRPGRDDGQDAESEKPDTQEARDSRRPRNGGKGRQIPKKSQASDEKESIKNVNPLSQTKSNMEIEAGRANVDEEEEEVDGNEEQTGERKTASDQPERRNYGSAEVTELERVFTGRFL